MSDIQSNTDSVGAGSNLSPYPSSSTSPSSSGFIVSDGPDSSSLPSLLPDSPELVDLSSNQTRTPRKGKPRINLAPDQPPTTQGRPRARVFVACVQCRARKIRCDGAKPVCYHCSQRGGNEQCSYDALPKRRGPDRIQGARIRGTESKEDDGPPRRRRRRPPTVEQAAGGESNGTRRSRVTAKPSTQNTLEDPDRPELSESSTWFSSTNETLTFESTSNEHPHGNVDEAVSHIPSSSSMPATYAALTEKIRELNFSDITPDPSVQFSRRIWWDHLCNLYAVSMRVSYHSSSQGLAYRNGSISQIIRDVRFIFGSSPHWFSFLNVPRFYNTFLDPVRRSRMQPSLLLSLLAVSTFFQSSERANLEEREESRRLAMVLRDEAQGYLEASLHARAINDELAQAAWVLSFFEICGHSQHQMSRLHSSLSILDSIIRSLAMQYLDASNPTASTFVRNTVPVVQVSSEKYVSTSQHYTSISKASPPQQYVQQQQIAVDPTIRTSSCPCNELSLGSQWPEAQEKVPYWTATPTWNREWTEGEIRREECRRLCWSTLMLVSGQTSYANATKWGFIDLFMIEPSNYSILFPGETLFPSHAHLNSMGGKDTVWALYIRTMLLWNSCVRMRHITSISDLDMSVFAMGAWIETEAIEEALNRHTCRVERAFFFHPRELLFNTRMCISYEFQRFIPQVLIGLNRKKSEEWLRTQGLRAKMIVLAMHTITGNSKDQFKLRPWFMWWYMGQILRALTLWEHDNSLTIALDVCKAFLEPIEYLITLYPGPGTFQISQLCCKPGQLNPSGCSSPTPTIG
ncbi:hypothetical protein BJV74DRAFT_770667 [Russula compacta]|nr:hypothetical protein BJV74DRAFT_770667 [Russula compacta]